MAYGPWNPQTQSFQPLPGQGQTPQVGAPAPAAAPTQQAAATPATTQGVNQNYPNLSPTGTDATLNPGSQNPFARDNSPIMAAPGIPNQQQSNAFLPSVFRDPYLQGLNAAVQSGNWASQALPGASAFQQSLYSPGITPMEQTYLQSAAQLSNNQLSNTQANLAGMFENSASHGSLAPAMLQAANTSGAQLGQLAGQMGTQREQMATNAMPFTFGFPIQAAQAGQQSSQGLFGMGQQAMYGDLAFPMAQQGSNAFASPTVISQPGTSSSKGK